MYEFLDTVPKRNDRGVVDLTCSNAFGKVSKEDIIKAELSLKMRFPSELRKFYEEVGCGYLTTPKNPPSDYRFLGTNLILPPTIVERFYHGQLLNEDYECYMSENTYELLEPGDIPVFEIGDSSSFMIMKPQSENPNAVYTDTGIKIEDSFDEFINNLKSEEEMATA